MINTTLCYVTRGNEVLMLHRVKKKNDINKDKWVGVGGHFEEGLRRIRTHSDALFASLGYERIPDSGQYRVVRSNRERVALFAHQGFGIAFFASMLDIPYPVISTHFDFGHSSMSVINFEKSGKYVYPKVLQVANRYAAEDKNHSKLDAVLVAGDFVDYGTLSSMEKFREIYIPKVWEVC